MSLTGSEIANLAPLILRNYREDRFCGEKNRSTLSEFADEDSRSLLSIYHALQSIFQELLDGHHDPEHVRRVLTDRAAQREIVANDTRHLGIATLQINQSRHLAQVIHDVRGGALQSLLIWWEMFAAFPDTSGLPAAFFLIRDQLKIMRNCVADLDTQRFATTPRERNMVPIFSWKNGPTRISTEVASPRKSSSIARSTAPSASPA